MAGRHWVSLALLAALPGCAFFAAPKQPKAGAGDVRIGYVGSFSGTGAEYGGASRDGAQMAIDAVNATGGVLGGRKLTLETRDDQSAAEPAVKGALELLDAGAVGLIGTNASSSTREVITKAAYVRGAVLISPSATSPQLTDGTVTTGGWFFRTVPSDALQGEVVAKMALEEGKKKLGVIYVDAPYGQGFAKRLEAAMAAGGGATTLVPYEETAEPKASYADVLGKVYAASPDAIVLIGYVGEASVMINEWQASGQLPGVAWYFGDSLQAQSFVDNVANKGVLEGRRGTAPAAEAAFVAAHQARYGRLPRFDAASAYDAIMLFALAIEAGKSTERGSVRTQVPLAASGGTKFTPEKIGEALAAARAGQDLDYDGYAGPVDLDAHGDVTSGAYEVWSVKDGQIVSTGEIRRP